MVLDECDKNVEIIVRTTQTPATRPPIRDLPVLPAKCHVLGAGARQTIGARATAEDMGADLHMLKIVARAKTYIEHDHWIFCGTICEGTMDKLQMQKQPLKWFGSYRESQGFEGLGGD